MPEAQKDEGIVSDKLKQTTKICNKGASGNPATISEVEVNGVQITATTDPEVAALAELDKKLLVARDRIRMVARGQTPGFYWHGRPGTCKTHTVLTLLEEMGVEQCYHKGNITQGGLLEILHGNRDGTIVLDDVSAIFSDKKAVQYLLAALGRQQGKPMPMSYVRQGKSPMRFEFAGGIICISNLPVPPQGMLAAFKSRVHTLNTRRLIWRSLVWPGTASARTAGLSLIPCSPSRK